MTSTINASRRRRLALTATTTAGLMIAAGLALAPAANSAPVQAAPALKSLAPVVKHTGKAPTGYAVTFSLYAPDAERVQIKGEWYFERPSHLPQLAGTPELPVIPTQGILPADWQPGDAPIAYPNATAANWPVIDMKERGNSGVWEWTTPLPSGVFTYGYFVDCPSDTGAGCAQAADPANLGWDAADDLLPGTRQASSQVYVPSDADFDTVDYSWQAPAEEQGALSHRKYTSPGHVTPAGENYLTVYTPAGYDADRAEPYPALEALARARWLARDEGLNTLVHRILSLLYGDLRHPAYLGEQMYRRDGLPLDPAAQRAFYRSELARLGLQEPAKVEMSRLVADLIAADIKHQDGPKLYSILSSVAHAQRGGINAFVQIEPGTDHVAMHAPLPTITELALQVAVTLLSTTKAVLSWYGAVPAELDRVHGAMARAATRLDRLPDEAFGEA